MTPIESFVVALLSIGGCGFLCGIPSDHERLKRSRDVELPKVSSALQLLALLCVPIAVVYAWLWGAVVDGRHFIWLTGVAAWLGGFALGHGVVTADYSRMGAWLS